MSQEPNLTPEDDRAPMAAHMDSESDEVAGSTAARIAKDQAIINPGNAMHDLSDFGDNALTEQDL